MIVDINIKLHIKIYSINFQFLNKHLYIEQYFSFNFLIKLKLICFLLVIYILFAYLC